MPTIQEFESGKFDTSFDALTTTYPFNGKHYPLFQEHSINGTIENIRNLNKRASLVTILITGKSSAGKSVLSATLAHKISCENPDGIRYIIKWFKREDIMDLVKIIGSLQKGLPYILIFQDLSWIFDMATPSKRKEVMNAFTTIRHELSSSKVILILQIHWMRAMPPMMRDSYFRFVVSMASEDKKNALDLIGWEASHLINKYHKIFSCQMQQGYFFLNKDSKSYRYATDEPFRCALLADMESVHYCLIPKEFCGICKDPEDDSDKEKIDAKKFVDEFYTAYSKIAAPALEYFGFFVKGYKSLPRSKQRAIQFLIKMFSKYDVDFKEVTEEIHLRTKEYGKHHLKYTKLHNKMEDIITKPNDTQNEIKNETSNPTDSS